MSDARLHVRWEFGRFYVASDAETALAVLAGIRSVETVMTWVCRQCGCARDYNIPSCNHLSRYVERGNAGLLIELFVRTLGECSTP